MARKKNASIVGVTPFDVDVDALTLRHTIENAIGNTALVHDMLTGENGELNTIRHIGGGRGCPLGIPLWQQSIDRTVNYIGTGTAKGGTPGPVWLIAHPFFIPEGENSFTVRVYANGYFENMKPQIRITTTTGTTQRGPLALSVVGENNRGRDLETYEVEVNGLATGLFLVFLEAQAEGMSSSDIYIESWHGFFPRKRTTPAAPVRSNTLAGNVVGVTTPSASEGVAHVNFQDTTFYADSPIDSYQTAYLDRNLNGLEEFGSGWPAGGNTTYTHVDHNTLGVADNSDPARSRFHAGTRSLYASEPEFDFPWLAAGCGAYGLDGKPVIDPTASAPSNGMLSWFAPYPLTASSLVMHRAFARAPDFQTTTSRLKWAVLAATDLGAGATAWQMSVDCGGAAVTSAFGAAFAAGAAPACLTVATGTALAFTADANNVISLTSSKTSAFAATYTEFFLLGFCLYWEP